MAYNKKVVVLNGSPRPYGNTSNLISAFIKGVKSAGGETVQFDLHRMMINPCLGCCSGGKNRDFPCVQIDEMGKIYKELQDADVICFASPLYFWTISGQLKITIDRMLALAECNPHYGFPKKRCVLIATAFGTDFEELIRWYKHCAEHIGWIDCGQVLCGNLRSIGDIYGNPKLDEAFQLGASL